MPASYPTKIIVFIESGGKCVKPECQSFLVQDGTLIGEIAHIYAENEGARFKPELSLEERNNSNNLIALCSIHHTIIDDLSHENEYPAELLFTWKAKAKSWAQANSKNNENYKLLINLLLTSLEDNIDGADQKIDQGDGKHVLEIVERVSFVLSILNDQKLTCEFDLLKARALQSTEKIKEARILYESLIINYPDDPRPILYLAELDLNDNEFEKNNELLKKAEKLNSLHPLLILEKLVRAYRVNEPIDLASIDEKLFPADLRMKSNFYRLYAAVYAREGNYVKAEEFIEKAIQANPNKFGNYDMKIALLEENLFKKRVIEPTESDKFISLIDKVLELAEQYHTSPRNRLVLFWRKINMLIHQNRISEVEESLNKCFELIFQCHFDHLIDQIIRSILRYMLPPETHFTKLLNFISSNHEKISNETKKFIFLQLIERDSSLNNAKEFFTLIKASNYLQLIDNILKEQYKEAINSLQNDQEFMVALINTLKLNKAFREALFEALPENEQVDKNRLALLMHYYDNNFDGAFEILKRLELNNMIYFEAKIFAEIAHKKRAWEYEIIALNRLKDFAREKTAIVDVKLKLFSAHLQLGKFLETIKIGEELLADIESRQLLSSQSQELLLGQVLYSHMQRQDFEKAKKILELYPNIAQTYEFKIQIEAEIYINLKEGEKALNAVITGLKLAGRPTSEQYGELMLIFTQITNLQPVSTASLEEIQKNTFVKLMNQERWFYIGEGAYFDASYIAQDDPKYNLFLGKKRGEKIELPSLRYSSEINSVEIESILTIEGYLYHQAYQCFISLSKEGRWNKGFIVETPISADGKVDLQNLHKAMKDLKADQANFFERYCKENLPLAFLAVNQGGLIEAIGKILSEKRGYIRSSDGTQQEFDKQKQALLTTIKEGKNIYLDGTSTLIMAQIGLLPKLIKMLPNVKVPQQVLNLLYKLTRRLQPQPGQIGKIDSIEEKINYSEINLNETEEILNRIKEGIQTIESKQNILEAVSEGVKTECSMEKNIPSELVDACVLAQEKEGTVLTEDYIYLHANSYQTQKAIPKYFSLFTLIKYWLEDGKISVKEYLDYFAQLASYRERFLIIDTKDLELAVMGKGTIYTFQPENIKKLSFWLTIAKSYGVSKDAAIKLLAGFLSKILLDDSIFLPSLERLFNIILDCLPNDEDEFEYGKAILNLALSMAIIEQRRGIILSMKVNEKLNALRQSLNIRNKGILLI